jgi:hypothetical protein
VDGQRDFAPLVVFRAIWRVIRHAQVHFLLVLLLEAGALDFALVMNAIRGGSDPKLTPGLICYFFPEFTEAGPWVRSYVLQARKDECQKFCDEYEAQCERVLDAEQLAQFRMTRRMGVNHNPLAEAIGRDQVIDMDELWRDGKREIRMSLFEQSFDYGRTKSIDVLDYTASV